MDLVIPIIMFIVGLIVIVKGGDYFVDASRWVSEITGIPKLIIGATVISLATTLPELFVSSIATYNGSVGIATGNAIGSVIANVGVGMSISLIFLPVTVDPKSFNAKAVLMLAVTTTLWIFTVDGQISMLEGFILLAELVFFLYLNIKTISSEEVEETPRPAFTKQDFRKNVALFIIGATGIILGANLLVDNGTILARAFGVSEAVIGLTIIAIGTSLPEITTAITAAVKKEPSLSIGNIIGANIIDMTLILPICSFLSGGTLAVEPSTIFVDIPAALLIIGVAVIPPLLTKKFFRLQGFCMVGTYAAYLAYVTLF